MAFRVTVRWPNGDSELLPESGAKVELQANGTALSPTSSAVGSRVFEVPDGTTTVRLTAVFSATLGPVSGPIPNTNPPVPMSAGAVTAEVLRIEQTYSVVGGNALRAETIDDYRGPHPLAAFKKTAAASRGGLTIVLQTEFVDAEPFYAAFAARWPFVVSQRQPGTRLCVLGHTGGNPRIWFAVAPNGSATFTNGFQSCLVFYRPRTYVYSRVGEPHQASSIGRYLLMPKPTDGYGLMRCRFEDCLVRSERSLVLLYPWQSGGERESGAAHGIAITAALPSLCDKAIRYLWSRGVVCKGTGNVRLGSLGLAGFSHGGFALWTALRNNFRRVVEVYAFDCRGTDAAAPTIIQWFTKRDVQLRMVGGAFSIDSHNRILKSIETIDNFHGPRERLTLFVTTPEYYAAGHNTMWDHYIGGNESLRNSDDARHQFAICGGEIRWGRTEPYDFNRVETYLLNFLRQSRFLPMP